MSYIDILTACYIQSAGMGATDNGMRRDEAGDDKETRVLAMKGRVVGRGDEGPGSVFIGADKEDRKRDQTKTRTVEFSHQSG